ncbi:MAG: hypothetical protein Q7T21_09360, partial [Gallionella sp.]|nr:hypothetical protein [Gallionella sp.]
NYNGAADAFSSYNEADVPTAGGGTLQQYYFNYSYGNGDNYYGYGYNDSALTGVTYAWGQQLTVTNELGLTGTYTIDSVYATSWGVSGEIYVNSYYDGDIGGAGWNTSVSGFGQFGLGTESGTVYNYNGFADAFSSYNEADVPTAGNGGLQQYYFHYTYATGGDVYYGYGYNNSASSSITYSAGQSIAGGSGTYTIDSVYGTSFGISGEVYVNSYFDGNGAGWNTSVSGFGQFGLGTEGGTVYNYNGFADTFSSTKEANVSTSSSGGLQQYYFHYDYGNGDTYYGYGYNDSALTGITYTASTTAAQSVTNQLGLTGYYYIDSVYSTSLGISGEVFVNSYYDGNIGGAGWNTTAYGSGITGLGSESGSVSNYGGTTQTFSNYFEANVPTTSLQGYDFHYTFASGDIYYGYGYTATGTYTALANPVIATEPGIYTIDAVYTSNYGTAGQVYVYSYNDASTDAGVNTYANGSGTAGLGSESGTVSNYNNYSQAFSNVSEANIPTTSFSTLQGYNFHYTYNTGDVYYGYGYNDPNAVGGVTSYTTLQTVAGANGTYTIDSVYSVGIATSGQIYVTSYNDINGAGSNTTVSGSGAAGLGSELGTVSNYSGVTSNFNPTTEATVASTSLQGYDFHYTFVSGDVYYGYGYNSSAIYTAAQTIVLANGTYTVDAVYTSNYGSAGQVYVYSYNDASTDAGINTYANGSGMGGLGSESGTVSNYNNFSQSFSNILEANVPTSSVATLQQYNFHYVYTSGDVYYGYGYNDSAVSGIAAYFVGQTIVLANGTYTIDSAYSTNYGTSGQLYVNSYNDANTDAGMSTYVNGSGVAGLGSESGTVFNYNNYSQAFSNTMEADVPTTFTPTLQQYNFHYNTASGDVYYGYGYAAPTTYTAGPTAVAGATGAYTIDSVFGTSTGTLGQVFVNSYNDFNSAGLNTQVVGSGTGGLGSESGTVYDYMGAAGSFNFTLDANVVAGSGPWGAGPYAPVTLIVGSNLTGAVDFAYNKDWYSINLTAGTAYQFAQSSTTGLDSYLRLYDSSGFMVAFNDDSGGSTNSLMPYTPGISATYYVSAGGYYASTGGYNLTVTSGSDATAPTIVFGGSVAGFPAILNFDFSESIQLTNGIAGLTAYKNGITPMTVTGAGATGFTMAVTTSDTLNAGDYVVATYNTASAAGNIQDLAGNQMQSATMVFSIDGATVDLQSMQLPGGSFSPVFMRGAPGIDIFTGTGGNDIIQTGRGADIINGSWGADTIKLQETASASDTVILQAGASGYGSILNSNYSDQIYNFVVDGVVFVDVGGVATPFGGAPNAAINDMLNLPSNTIAANGTNIDGINAGLMMSHSIASGIVTFGDTDVGGAPVLINEANLNTALTYLQTNITGVGETVAFAYDSDSNGINDSTVVFQDNGLKDISAVLNGVNGVTLGNLGAGVNVVQLVDNTSPDVNGAISINTITNSLVMNYSENVTYSTGAPHGSILLNGIGGDIFIGGSTTGNVYTANTSATILQTDWLYVTVGSDIADASGNVTMAAGFQAAFGGSGDNIIDMSGYGVGGLFISGFAGNDTITGISAGAEIEGGIGADDVTGGAGADKFRFKQGDSTLVSGFDSNSNLILDSGDTFAFAGGVADVITNFGTRDNIFMDTVLDNNPVNSIAAPTSGLAIDQSYFTVQGDYLAGTFTVNTVSGIDTMVVYDGDSTAGVTQTAMVLSGVTLSQLQQTPFNSSIDYADTPGVSYDVQFGQAGQQSVNDDTYNNIDGFAVSDTLGGNDFFVMNQVNGGNYLATTVNGGAGLDAIQFNFNYAAWATGALQPTTINDVLVPLSAQFSGIEGIGLQNSFADTLKLGLSDVFNLSDTNGITIRGEAFDTVQLSQAAATTWQSAGQTMDGGVTYDVWHGYDATNDVLVLLQQGMAAQVVA